MTPTPEEPLEDPEVAPGGDPGLDPNDPDATPEPALPGEEPDPGVMPEEGPMNVPK